LRRSVRESFTDSVGLFFSPVLAMAKGEPFSELLVDSIRANFASSVNLYFLPALTLAADIKSLLKAICEIPGHIAAVIANWLSRELSRN
jgi:hypothetical protein